MLSNHIPERLCCLPLFYSSLATLGIQMQFDLICNFLDDWCISALTIRDAFLKLFIFIFCLSFSAAVLSFYWFVKTVSLGRQPFACYLGCRTFFRACNWTFGSVSDGGYCSY
jgi:hypothetical protein